jgi:hypothetical protein
MLVCITEPNVDYLPESMVLFLFEVGTNDHRCVCRIHPVPPLYRQRPPTQQPQRLRLVETACP